MKVIHIKEPSKIPHNNHKRLIFVCAIPTEARAIIWAEKNGIDPVYYCRRMGRAYGFVAKKDENDTK